MDSNFEFFISSEISQFPSLNFCQKFVFGGYLFVVTWLIMVPEINE